MKKLVVAAALMIASATAQAGDWKVVGSVCMSPSGPVGPEAAISNPHCFGANQPAYVLGLGGAQAACPAQGWKLKVPVTKQWHEPLIVKLLPRPKCEIEVRRQHRIGKLAGGKQ